MFSFLSLKKAGQLLLTSLVFFRAWNARELLPRVELGTSSLPRMRSTTELKQHFLLLRRGRSLLSGKRDSNPRPPAWKASALSTELFPRLLPFSEGKRVAALWVRMDSNHRSRRQQIYSLPHLATLEHTHFSKIFIFGAERERASSRTRTNDRWITNLVLYQLSYRGISCRSSIHSRRKSVQNYYKFFT